ncbi:MAG TPA: hypothetical protein VLE47_03730 [Candidatus Saccharimonadales bacterium]|nr:hypothetical protein [Candidatus Saccharimonadales bacterium]
MSEKIVRTTYACNLCGCEFATEEGAEHCEEGGLTEPTYQLGDLFARTNQIQYLFVGAFRGTAYPSPVGEIDIFPVIAGCYEHNNTSSKKAVITHRISYILPIEDDGYLNVSTRRLTEDYTKLTTSEEGKKLLVFQMLHQFRGKEALRKQMKPLAEKAADELLALAVKMQDEQS